MPKSTTIQLVCIINHSLDTRYHETMISTHDKVMAPCLQTAELNEIWTMEYGFNEPNKTVVK